MKVIVGMSGGVDSSVAALLLKQQGHDVTGIFMKNWEEKDENGVCTAEEDWKDVQRVCEHIQIPYYAVNFAKEYEERVFSYFLHELRNGRTPNPDVLCNKEIKFKAFLDYAKMAGADKMATGHFVNTNNSGHLLRGKDSNKDQSYFLYMLKEAQLKQALFPVGNLTKPEVRTIAHESGIPVFNKKDSTGICFIGERNFRHFLAQYLPEKPGLMRTEKGEIVGEHIGLMYYTIGQRRGLGIGGKGDGRSYFVIRKDLEKNELIVCQGEDHPLLYADEAIVDQITWINEVPCHADGDLRIAVKLRYRQPDQQAVLHLDGTPSISFSVPQRAVTPGQSAVFYQGERCLGGAVIQTTIPTRRM